MASDIKEKIETLRDELKSWVVANPAGAAQILGDLLDIAEDGEVGRIASMGNERDLGNPCPAWLEDDEYAEAMNG